jgi:lysophospholipase L1-like esterase
MRFSLFFSFCMAVCITISVVAAEITLRAIHPNWRVDLRYQSDSTSIILPRPNLSDPQTNSLGAWGGPLNPVAETVLVFGDSNIQAAFVPEGDSFPVQLAATLGSFQVVNFGVIGYGPDQSVLRLRTLLDHHQHELGRVRAVVLNIFADNDLGDLIRNNLPAFNPSINSTVQRLQPDFTTFAMAANHYLTARAIFYASLASRLGAFLLPSDYYPPLYRAVYPPEMLREQLYEFGRYTEGQYTNVLNDYYDTAIALNVEHKLTASALETLHRVLALFLEISKQYDFCPLVIVEPSKTDVSNRARITAADMAVYAQANGYSYDPRRLSQIIEQVSEQIELPTLSLFDAFKGRPFYYTEEEMPDDNHWNPAGMKAAEILAANELRRTCALVAAQERR